MQIGRDTAIKNVFVFIIFLSKGLTPALSISCALFFPFTCCPRSLFMLGRCKEYSFIVSEIYWRQILVLSLHRVCMFLSKLLLLQFRLLVYCNLSSKSHTCLVHTTCSYWCITGNFYIFLVGSAGMYIWRSGEGIQWSWCYGWTCCKRSSAQQHWRISKKIATRVLYQRTFSGWDFFDNGNDYT